MRLTNTRIIIIIIIVTNGLSRTVSEINVNGDIRRKSPIFPTPVYLTPPMKELELGVGATGLESFYDGATGWLQVLR